MSMRLIVSCDSTPAEYAGATGQPCRAWLPTDTIDPVAALAAAVNAGWVYAKHPTLPRVVITCPACARARAAHEDTAP